MEIAFEDNLERRHFQEHPALFLVARLRHSKLERLAYASSAMENKKAHSCSQASYCP